MLLTALLCGIEVEKPRYRIQLFLEHQHALVFDDVTDFAIGIQDVAELARSHGADLHARRVAAVARALDAERALFDHALGPRAIAQVVRIGVEFVVRNGGLGPVEVARAIGARRHAVAAADAPIVVDDYDAVFLGPGRAGRADLGAWRIL